MYINEIFMATGHEAFDSLVLAKCAGCVHARFSRWIDEPRRVYRYGQQALCSKGVYRGWATLRIHAGRVKHGRKSTLYEAVAACTKMERG